MTAPAKNDTTNPVAWFAKDPARRGVG